MVIGVAARWHYKAQSPLKKVQLFSFWNLEYVDLVIIERIELK